MKRVCIFGMALCAGLFSIAGQAAGHKPTEITIGYFLNWPTPNQLAQIKQTYDRAMGLRVNWKSFQTSDEMSAAMIAGDIQIAYALSHVSFVANINRGHELTMVGVALDYSKEDNCIVADSAGITHGNATMLEGRRVATRVGGMTHFRLLKVLEHLGVDHTRVELVPMQDGASVIAALRRDEVVMACAYGKTLHALEDLGKPLMTSTQQAIIGLKVFDVVAVPTQFMTRNPGIVQDFMDVTEAANIQWRINPDPMRAAIARAATMLQSSSDRALQRFSFPTTAEQKANEWMGRLIPVYLKQIADFFVEQKQLEKSLDDYDQFVTTRFLR